MLIIADAGGFGGCPENRARLVRFMNRFSGL
jgi:hypothetical protein